MKKIAITILLIFFTPTLLFSDEILKPEYQKVVKPFIKALSNNDVIAISKIIRYPLKRDYPIPSIMNAEELIERFDQIFDKTLKKEILRSSIEKDWDDVGWRGIMLNRGTLWIDEDGSITSINYQSEYEKKLKRKLIEEEKKQLHPSLKVFENPCFVCVTSKLKIRIDYLGDYKYRYAVWSKETKQSQQPDLILNNGEYVPDGSGGNHYYEFINDQYKYRVYVINVYEEEQTPPGFLEVLISDKVILEQDIEKFIKP